MSSLPDDHTIKMVQMGASQGWECPNCHHVMSPWTAECPHCPLKSEDATTATIDKTPDMDVRVRLSEGESKR